MRIGNIKSLDDKIQMNIFVKPDCDWTISKLEQLKRRNKLLNKIIENNLDFPVLNFEYTRSRSWNYLRSRWRSCSGFRNGLRSLQ